MNRVKKVLYTVNSHMQREQEVQRKAQYFVKPHRVFSALEVSAERRTLGALLKDQLQLVRYSKAGTKYWFGREGEARLRQWIVNHALLTWQEDDNPREVETAILSDAGFVLPLNKVH